MKLKLLGPLLLLVIFCGCSERPAKLIPLRDFFRNPEKVTFRISPDGKYLSYLKPFKTRLNIYIQKIGTTEAASRVTSVTDRDIESYFWKGNDHLIYARDLNGDENYHLYLTNRTGSFVRDLTPFPGVQARVLDDREEDDHQLLIELNRRNRELFDVYRLILPEGRLELIARNPGNIVGWMTDHAGRLRLAAAAEGLKYNFLWRDNEREAFRSFLKVSYRDDFDPLFFTFDDRQLYALSDIGRDRDTFVKFDPHTGKELEVLYQRPDVDIDTVSYSKDRKVLLAAFYIADKLERKFFDPLIEGQYRYVCSKFPGREVKFIDRNRNEDTYIVALGSDRSLGSYYLYETKNNRLTKLADVSPWLPESELAKMEPISFSARDGLLIHGYLTLPKGGKRNKLPVVIVPHGGPWVRDSWGYDPEVQFLVNRGYAVLQMNFRGSTGYGKKFEQAGYKQWGRKMQDDITDSVKWLIQQGVADPKRVGIYGGSYGGYAVLAGLTFTPELYACGIDYVGISNLFTFLKTIPPYWRTDIAMTYEMIGDPVKDRELFQAISPLFHADRIRAPLLVIQGAKDPRVNINESDQIVAALRKRGIEVTYLVKENEGHGFSNEENRLESYRAIEYFLARHLGGRAER